MHTYINSTQWVVQSTQRDFKLHLTFNFVLYCAEYTVHESQTHRVQ